MEKTWAAFLRGMNVGGHRITNAALKEHFEGMGFTRVATFRASGNVLFSTPLADPTARIEEGLAERLGYAVPTFLRSKEALEGVLGFQAFTAQEQASHGKIQITFLRQAPTPDVAREALALESDDDLLRLRGRELYWLPRAGISTSDLDHRTLNRLLGEGTTRTVGTVTQVYKKL